MPAHITPLEWIEDFLAQKRIAMVGGSRQVKDFSVLLFKELRQRGYDVVPINPHASDISGQRPFRPRTGYPATSGLRRGGHSSRLEVSKQATAPSAPRP